MFDGVGDDLIEYFDSFWILLSDWVGLLGEDADEHHKESVCEEEQRNLSHH